MLDKSFLDKATNEAVVALCDNHGVLMSDELFFGLMTTRKSGQ